MKSNQEIANDIMKDFSKIYDRWHNFSDKQLKELVKKSIKRAIRITKRIIKKNPEVKDDNS